MQFIGEVDFRRAGEGGGEVLVLLARVVRCVDGLDEQLFEKALSVRRAFEAQLEAPGAAAA